MQSRFGADISNVKIHTVSQTSQSSHEIKANAYTTRNYVIFNDGVFSHHSESGKRLLAHEFTYVLQQGGINEKSKEI